VTLAHNLMFLIYCFAISINNYIYTWSFCISIYRLFRISFSPEYLVFIVRIV